MIYIIQEKGLFRGRIKIGYTKEDAQERFRIIQSQSPSELKLLFVLPGDKQNERDCHRRFAAYRLHGEWFKYGLRLKLFIWEHRFMMDMIPRSRLSLIQRLFRDTANFLLATLFMLRKIIWSNDFCLADYVGFDGSILDVD